MWTKINLPLFKVYETQVPKVLLLEFRAGQRIDRILGLQMCTNKFTIIYIFDLQYYLTDLNQNDGMKKLIRFDKLISDFG